MFNLISNPLVIALLFLVIVVAFLVYICGVYKAQADNLKSDVMFRDTQIKFLKEYKAESKVKRKLYTFVTETDRLEDIVSCRDVGQYLKLTLVSGSMHFVSKPSSYILMIQDRIEEEN